MTTTICRGISTPHLRPGVCARCGAEWRGGPIAVRPIAVGVCSFRRLCADCFDRNQKPANKES